MGKPNPREMIHSHSHLNSYLEFPLGQKGNEDGMLKVKGYLDDVPRANLLRQGQGGGSGSGRNGEAVPHRFILKQFVLFYV